MAGGDRILNILHIRTRINRTCEIFQPLNCGFRIRNKTFAYFVGVCICGLCWNGDMAAHQICPPSSSSSCGGGGRGDGWLDLFLGSAYFFIARNSMGTYCIHRAAAGMCRVTTGGRLYGSGQ